MYNIFIFFLYLFSLYSRIFFFFFFNDTATTEIYTLSLHDALPISDGNYLKQFSEDYFTDRYSNEWGEALNFDGPNSAPVREFVCSNAAYWADEFHFDGLRLDATQQIFDASQENIMAALASKFRAAAGGRKTFI